MKKVLFCVESVYQLFNAITLCLTKCVDKECDLIISNLTMWEKDMLKRLKEKQVFSQIIQAPTIETEADFFELKDKEKSKVIDDPVLFFKDKKAPIKPVYTQLFVPIDHIFWKMIYRYHIVNGVNVDIFMYDEGLRAYTMELHKMDKEKIFMGNYAKAPFYNNIVGYYLYRPELYYVKKYDYELLQIPNPAKNENVKNTLLYVFGELEMPEQTYIYMEDFFFANNLKTNDYDVFCEISKIVGRENIIVKGHPRAKSDRFGGAGYQVTPQSIVPWEIQLLGSNIEKKVLISFSSTSILSPFIIFDMDMHVISLKKILVSHNPTIIDEGFEEFFFSTLKKINDKKIRVYMPTNLDELKEILRFIELDAF